MVVAMLQNCERNWVQNYWFQSLKVSGQLSLTPVCFLLCVCEPWMLFRLSILVKGSNPKIIPSFGPLLNLTSTGTWNLARSSKVWGFGGWYTEHFFFMEFSWR